LVIGCKVAVRNSRLMSLKFKESTNSHSAGLRKAQLLALYGQSLGSWSLYEKNTEGIVEESYSRGPRKLYSVNSEFQVNFSIEDLNIFFHWFFPVKVV
jgi:hypothetical protein